MVLECERALCRLIKGQHSSLALFSVFNSGSHFNSGHICCANEDEAEQKAAKLVECLLTEGKDAPLDEAPVLLPSWYNHDLIEKGQKYFNDNVFSLMAAKMLGLMGLLAVPSILRILVNTNKSSTPSSAYKRYLDTITHMMNWYQSDLRNPNSKGRKSLLNVRRLHSAANMNFGRITQRDLGITQFAFLGFALTRNDILGVPKEGFDGIIHFWRVIGHLLGVKDRFNLFQGCEKCSIAACRIIIDKVYSPGVEHPPPEFHNMTLALLRGMWPIMPVILPVSHEEFLRRMCGLQPKRLPIFSQIILNVLIVGHKLLSVPVLNYFLRPYFNYQIWLTLFFQKNAPFLAFIAFHDFWT